MAMHADWIITPTDLMDAPKSARPAADSHRAPEYPPRNRVDAATGRAVPMGERLVEQGLLTPTQVQDVLAVQQRTGRPFGDLCERMFGLSTDIIEAVWMDQYREISNEADRDEPIGRPSVEALQLVSARQAWQFRVVPLSLRAETIRMATTASHLAQASRFCTAVLERPAVFRIVSSDELAVLLQAHFPMGLTVRHIRIGIVPGRRAA
ncbi:MAG: hypothetical protein O2819_01900 [Planctomycetota bacterium]|nr:hypothetical protein [Planctomycetota bacterium]